MFWLYRVAMVIVCWLAWVYRVVVPMVIISSINITELKTISSLENINLNLIF